MQNINILFAFIQVGTAGVGAMDVGIFGYCRTDFSKHILQQPPRTRAERGKNKNRRENYFIFILLFMVALCPLKLSVSWVSFTNKRQTNTPPPLAPTQCSLLGLWWGGGRFLALVT